MTTQERTREAFEAWAREHAPWLDLHWIESPTNPIYATPVTRTGFAAWQASRIQALDEGAGIAERIASAADADWKARYNPHDQGRSMGADEVAAAIRKARAGVGVGEAAK